MKAIEYIMTGKMAIIAFQRRHSDKTAKQVYDDKLFFLPRLHCIDGFNISIQVHNGNYCSSENGYQEYGWMTYVEWGYPSIFDDLLNDSAEEKYCTNTVGSITIQLLEELVDKHGGIDLRKTFENV